MKDFLLISKALYYSFGDFRSCIDVRHYDIKIFHFIIQLIKDVLTLITYLLQFFHINSYCRLLFSPFSVVVIIPDRFVDQDSGINRRSEEHTSELQSRGHLVCRLLLEKKNKINRLRQKECHTCY